MTKPALTIGVLYSGEMGASLAALLRTRGLRVVTTLAGRGERTARRCREAGVVILDALADVIRESDIVFSLVPPAAAAQVAADYCELASRSPAGSVFVDANSIGPELAVELAARVAERGRDFVDAGINGLAKNLATTGTLFFSGARATEVAGLFHDAARVRLLGNEAGRASAMKMLLSGLSKGACALFVELALVARQRGLLAEMIEASSEIYPGISVVAERMLPTYPRHAERRATEMQELEQTVRAAGLEPCVIAAIRSLHETFAGVAFEDRYIGGLTVAWTVESVIERLAAEQVLAAEPLVGVEKQIEI